MNIISQIYHLVIGASKQYPANAVVDHFKEFFGITDFVKSNHRLITSKYICYHYIDK